MGSKAAAKASSTKSMSPHAKAIAQHMRDSLLPGDTPIDEAHLAEAASFLAETAAQRTPGQPAIAIQSISEDRRFTRIAIVNDDMPFLVDSTAAALAAMGLAIDRLIHPVVPVERKMDGTLAKVIAGEPDEAFWESMIYLEAPRVDAKRRQAIESHLRETLTDVRGAVCDWPDLQKAMAADVKRIDNEEGAALLEWLNAGMLTQLGHVVRKRNGEQENPLGICRTTSANLLVDASYDRAFSWFEGKGEARTPLIIKANHVSRVHRHVPLDLFIVPIREGKELVAL